MAKRSQKFGREPVAANIKDRLDEAYSIHTVSSLLHHWASKGDGTKAVRSEPFAPTYFAYAFFAFNSIYSTANWQRTFDDRSLSTWYCDCCGQATTDKSELQQIKSLCTATTQAFGTDFDAHAAAVLKRRWQAASAFIPAAAAVDVASAIEDIEPTEAGHRSSLPTELVSDAQKVWRSLAGSTVTDDRINVREKFARLLEAVYKVRCRVFHGAKPIFKLREPAQQRRCLAYTVVLTTTSELFFAAAERKLGWKPQAIVSDDKGD